MRIGDLDRIITLQRATVSQVGGEFNEDIEAWSTLATVYAAKSDVSAGEAMRAQEVGAQLSARFTIRRSSEVSDLNERDRLVFDGNVFNITGVREIARNRWLEIDAVRRHDVAAAQSSP